jgi:FkbM family methyltransferase
MLTWPDATGIAVRRRDFELGEAAFVSRYLRPRMVVLDVGAHGGFYTLLARRLVGADGSVIAFEPSRRERRRLHVNLWLNRFANVTVVPTAIGEEQGEAEFYIVHGYETGFSGRKRPNVAGRIEMLTVPLSTLDASRRDLGIRDVDLIKIDVEGGELAVLRGASRLLSTPPRPVVVCEISDERAKPWGHTGRAVYDYLTERGFDWFTADLAGALWPAQATERYHGNFVAIPSERKTALHGLVQDAS